MTDFEDTEEDDCKEKNILKRFNYIKYDEESLGRNKILKENFETLILSVSKHLGYGREKDFVLNKLEESWMWIGKSLKRDQEHRELYELHKERKNK